MIDGRFLAAGLLAVLIGGSGAIGAGRAQAQGSPTPRPTPQTRAAAPTASALRAGLAGRWSGTLGYRDYRTDAMNLLPVVTTIAAVPDGMTQTRMSKFDEGPRAKPVWITTIGIATASAGSVTSASFRAGRAPELETETMAVTHYAGPTRWTITYAQTGSDDDKPAEIRVTETRNGATLSSIKEVRPVGGGAPWRFRNETKLRRIGG